MPLVSDEDMRRMVEQQADTYVDLAQVKGKLDTVTDLLTRADAFLHDMETAAALAHENQPTPLTAQAHHEVATLRREIAEALKC